MESTYRRIYGYEALLYYMKSGRGGTPVTLRIGAFCDYASRTYFCWQIAPMPFVHYLIITDRYHYCASYDEHYYILYTQ